MSRPVRIKKNQKRNRVRVSSISLISLMINSTRLSGAEPPESTEIRTPSKRVATSLFRLMLTMGNWKAHSSKKKSPIVYISAKVEHQFQLSIMWDSCEAFKLSSKPWTVPQNTINVISRLFRYRFRIALFSNSGGWWWTPPGTTSQCTWWRRPLTRWCTTRWTYSIGTSSTMIHSRLNLTVIPRWPSMARSASSKYTRLSKLKILFTMPCWGELG